MAHDPLLATKIVYLNSVRISRPTRLTFSESSFIHNVYAATDMARNTTPLDAWQMKQIDYLHQQLSPVYR